MLCTLRGVGCGVGGWEAPSPSPAPALPNGSWPPGPRGARMPAGAPLASGLCMAASSAPSAVGLPALPASRL